MILGGEPSLLEFCRALPKAELHVHLEGSLDAGTLAALDPSLDPDEAAARYSFNSFSGFIESFKWAVGFLRTPEDYAFAAKRLIRSLAAENVRYAEITLAAGYVLWKGLNLGEVYAAARQASAAGPVEVRWVLDAIRQFGASHVRQVADFAVTQAGNGVVAFGIGGDESLGPASDFAGIFAGVKEAGLKLVPHAGETAGAPSVWSAIEAGADRIGHGIRSVEDPALLDHLRVHNIPLEICISSNAATGAVPNLESHPLRRLYDAGVPIVLNTDDPAMFHTTLSREYEIAGDVFGFTREELAALAGASFMHARPRR